MRCPECGEHLVEVVRRGVAIEECPQGHGLWIPPGALQTIPARERDSWLDRYVHLRW
jgi:Zn-finger nucleic acid-binding protein